MLVALVSENVNYSVPGRRSNCEKTVSAGVFEQLLHNQVHGTLLSYTICVITALQLRESIQRRRFRAGAAQPGSRHAVVYTVGLKLLSNNLLNPSQLLPSE